MKQTHTLRLLAAGLMSFAVFSARAQTAAPVPAAAPSSTLTFTPAFASQYMFRGARLAGPSFEPTVEWASGPLTLGVWANFPIKDKVPGQSDPEIDPYGSYTIELGKDLTLVPGFTLYTYPRAEPNNGFYKVTFEPSLALNYTVGAFKFTPKIYQDLVLDGPTAEFTAAFAAPLKDFGTELDFVGTVGSVYWKDYAQNTTPKIKNWGDYWLVGVSMPFALTKESKLVVGWAYTEGKNNYFKQASAPKVANTGAVGRGVFTLAYSYTY